MYNYIIGKITFIHRDHIVLENNGIGYSIYVSNPYSFQKDEELTLYVYQQIKEDSHLLFGFRSLEDKEIFLKLISVKGIGPKTAISALATFDSNQIITAIENGNVNILKKLPGIGPKAASQIVLDLQGKLVTQQSNMAVSKEYDEAIEVLVALGYRQTEVIKVMKSISDLKLDTNSYVKKALSLLVK